MDGTGITENSALAELGCTTSSLEAVLLKFKTPKSLAITGLLGFLVNGCPLGCP